MVRGVQPVSLVDWPGRICTVLFTAGCDFDCPWCHNRILVDPARYADLPLYSEEDLLNLLAERRGFVDGLCLTGGEPLIHGEPLRRFVRRLKDATGLPLKLDTNGHNPDELARWYDERLVDFTAMDIKNAFPKYARTVGLPHVDLGRIERSIRLVLERSPEYQFRITAVPDLVTDEDIRWIERTFGITLTVQEYRPPAVS